MQGASWLLPGVQFTCAVKPGTLLPLMCGMHRLLLLCLGGHLLPQRLQHVLDMHVVTPADVDRTAPSSFLVLILARTWDSTISSVKGVWMPPLTGPSWCI